MTLSKKFGPGILVTAAFIGPGTITTASAAGANFGFALVWALFFSVIATIVLQEMAARLGLVTRAGLAEAMRKTFSSAATGKLAVLLVVVAIGFGNAAYEAGNIAGAAFAVSTITGVNSGTAALVLGCAAGLLLASGRYRVLEIVLISLVLIMSGVFIWCALIVAPDFSTMLESLLNPSLPSGSVLTVIALIGTTVVPYNLFLHANAVREKWSEDIPLSTAVSESRWDTGLSVGLGGLITLAILSTAATAFFHTGQTFGGESMALQLEPQLGPLAKYIFAAGLFAGGLTSAITAPLAASYAVCGALNWPQKLDAPQFRLIWSTVLVTGTIFAALGSKPLTAIILAQVANGFLLPIVAIFLLVVMNRRTLLGDHRNGPVANIMGVLVVLIAIGLGAVKLVGATGLL
ncbi:MAG: Nramp family divalent metal transporter [Halieaceae bacterium]|jgi:manganese transport protein|nr:Nramp family divalent metal transporter [Halieaceae bacterium]